jgi:hypothetical protein
VTTEIKLVAGSEEPGQSAMNTAAKATRTIAGKPKLKPAAATVRPKQAMSESGQTEKNSV